MKITREDLDFARKVIVEKIDLDGKFVPKADYEMSGKMLQWFLAFAFSEGKEAAKWKKKEANRAR